MTADRELPPAATERPPPVLEPEVLDSLDAASPEAPEGAMPRLGWTAQATGCGCLAAPLAVVAGVLVSSLLALGWVLRFFRMLVALFPGLRRGAGGPPPGRRPRDW